MLQSKITNVPVDAVLLIDMVIDGDPTEAGEVVTLPPRDYKYLTTYGRVLPATKENVAAVKAEVAAQKEQARKQSAANDELANTKTALANALAEIEKLKKGK
jgi:hypothetical protein